MAAVESSRQVSKLPDYGEIEVRRLNRIDMLELFATIGGEKTLKVLNNGAAAPEKVQAYHRMIVAALPLAVVRPKIVTEGLPSAAPTKDLVHVRDLSDADLEALEQVIVQFALGGARFARFQEGAEGEGPGAARPDRAPVQPAADRDPRAGSRGVRRRAERGARRDAR